MILNYRVAVTTGAQRPLTEKDWLPIARKIAKTVRGRSKLRKVHVWCDIPYMCVSIDATGRMTIRQGGHDLAFKSKP